MTYLRWCYKCKRRSEPLAESPESPTCTHCGSHNTMVECVGEELLAMDAEHDQQDCYGSAWVEQVCLRREEEEARRGVGVIEGGEDGRED